MSSNMSAKCPITGVDANFYCRKGDATYLMNKRDSIIFLSQMPDLGSMSEYSNTHYTSGAYKEYVNAKDLKMLTANIRLDKIAKYKLGKKILDIGCGAGFFLEAAANRGYQVHGVELSAAAIVQASPEIRNRIIQGDVQQELKNCPQDIDCITAFDIIEHLHNPVQFIEDVKTLLKPYGLLVISTPDTRHFLRTIMRSYWPMLQPLQHTILFSRSAMRKMLEAAGFTDICIETTYKYLSIEYLSKQLQVTNKMLSYLMRLCMTLLPSVFTRRAFRINIGEFIVFARKSV